MESQLPGKFLNTIFRRLPYLSIEAIAKPTCSLAEGGFATLKNVADSLTNLSVFQAAALRGDWRQSALWMWPGVGDNQLQAYLVTDIQ